MTWGRGPGKGLIANGKHHNEAVTASRDEWQHSDWPSKSHSHHCLLDELSTASHWLATHEQLVHPHSKNERLLNTQ